MTPLQVHEVPPVQSTSDVFGPSEQNDEANDLLALRKWNWSTGPSPFQRQGRRVTLPMRLEKNGFLRPELLDEMVPALPDTGSDVNAISRALVSKLGLKLAKTAPESVMVKLSNGESLEAIGTVSIRCSFAVEIDLFPKIPRDFVVFENLATDVPLIMGRDFLQQTQTLTIYRDRLQERKSDLTIPKVMNMTLSRRRLPCFLDYTLVYAIADTGSDLNLVKEDYAIERGFLIEKVSENERFVRLPGDTTVEITGKVKVRFDTVVASPTNTSAVTTDASNDLSVPASVSAATTESPGSAKASDETPVLSSEPNSYDINANHYCTFYVMVSLTTNVLLGEELLDSIDAFGTHLDSFVDVRSAKGDMSDMQCIKWLNSMERKLIRSPKLRLTWPPNFVKCKHSIGRLFCEILIINRYLARPEATGA